jgi:hypothetical protein
MQSSIGHIQKCRGEMARETNTELYENGRSWEKRESLLGEGGEIASFCKKVPRRHPLALAKLKKVELSQVMA